jgi:hypothetical protein
MSVQEFIPDGEPGGNIYACDSTGEKVILIFEKVLPPLNI